MPDFTVHPLANTQIPSAAVAEHFQKIAAFKDRIHSGYTIITSAASLTVTVQPGIAYVSGRQVGKTGDASAAKALAPNATNHVYLKSDGNVEVNSTGVAPSDSTKIWEIVTDGTGVPGTPTDTRSFVVDVEAAVRVQSLLMSVNGATLEEALLKLKGSQPYVRLEDTSVGGVIGKLISRDGHVKITNDAGSVVAMVIDVANARVGIGANTAPTVALDVTGAVNVSSSITAPTIGPDSDSQHTIPNVAASILAVLGVAQTWTAVQTFGTNISMNASGVTAGTLAVARGGTGVASYTIGDILYASGTTTLSKLGDVATGNALISGGVGAAPSWGKIALTTHVSGVLPVANGGTNISSYAVGDLIYASGATALSKLAAVATGSVLISAGVTTAPAWGQIADAHVDALAAIAWTKVSKTGSSLADLATRSASDLTSGTLAVARGGTGLASYTIGDLLYASGATALSALTAVATGNVLISGGVGAAPSWGQVADAHISASAAIGWSKVSKTGSSLADLATRSASDLSSGTLDDARLSSNVVMLSGTQSITGTKTFSALVTASGGIHLNSAMLYFSHDGATNANNDHVWFDDTSNVFHFVADAARGVTANAGIVVRTLTVNVATGTAPMTVTSTTLVSNLTAHYLGAVNQDAAFFRDAGNLNAGTVNAARLPTAASGVAGIIPTTGLTDAMVATAAAIAWSKLSKTGSSLADLATRSASDLTTGTLAVARGGTGLASYAIGDLLYASAATTLSKLAAVATGNVLISQGVTTAPVWGKVTDGHIDALAAIAWSKISKTSSSLADLATRSASDLTTGTLAVARGGTGLASYAVGDLIYASGATALSKITAVATGNVLISQGIATAPIWSQITDGHIDALAAISWTKVSKTGSSLADLATRSASDLSSGTLAVARGGTGLASYTIGDLIYASGGTTLSKLAAVATGSVLISQGVGAAPSWGDIADSHVSASAAIAWTKVSKSGSSLADLATRSASDLTSGTLAVARGGTGLASYAVGDLIYASGTTTLAKVGIGSAGQILTVSGGVPVWAEPEAGQNQWFLTPGGATLPNTAFANLTKITGTNLPYYELDFDAATAEAAYWGFHALAATNLTIEIFWKAAATTGNVVWKVSTRGVDDASTWDSALSTTGTVTDAAKGTAEQVNKATITLTTPYTAGQWVQFKLERDAASGSDTMTGDAKVLGIRLSWA